MEDKLIATYVGTDDKLVNKDASKVHWLSIEPSSAGTLAIVEIYDGFDATGTAAWRGATAYGDHFPFNPPIPINQAICVEVVSGVASYTIGYASLKWQKEAN